MILGNSLLVYVKTASHCQQKCSFCFYKSGSAPKKIIDFEKTKDWFKRLEKFAPWIETPQINYFGGEPMLAPLNEMVNLREELKDLWKGNLRFTITTNLVYALTEDRINFFKSLDGMSTSWDASSRFETISQFELWKKNCIKLIKEHNINLTLQITLTAPMLKLSIKEIFDMCKEIGFSDVQFEKLSINGGVLDDMFVVPRNEELNEWFFEMYKVYTNGKYYENFSNAYLNSILTSYVYSTYSGCRSRNCETKVFTLNTNGTVANCPNYAEELNNQIGTVDQEIKDLLLSKNRQKSISCESKVDPRCSVCPVYSICAGGCYASSFFNDNDICSEAKKLMIHLKEEKNYSLYKTILNGFKGSEVL